LVFAPELSTGRHFVIQLESPYRRHYSQSTDNPSAVIRAPAIVEGFWAVKDFYDVLDIPLSATTEEIKAKYRQLVRIYHPDRFTNPADKQYAEEKLKELNEAYAALAANAPTRRPVTNQLPPAPIIEPALLDFGVVPSNQRTRARIQVGNTGGTAQSISFTYSDEQPWFTVTKGRQIYPDRPMPLEFEVVVNTTALEPSQRYTGWVEINMDGVTARSALLLEVGESNPERLNPRRLLVGSLLALLVTALLVTVPLLRLFDQQAPIATAVQEAALTEANRALVYPTVEESAADSWAPIFSPDGQQIAFLSAALGALQLYVRDPDSGRLRQLTSSPEAKSAVAWSPDGLRLAYIAGEQGQHQIHVIVVENGALTALAPVTPAAIQRFAWATDGQTLVMETSENGLRRLYVANPVDGEVSLLDPPPAWATLKVVGNSP
jgi:hypothetical protein